MDIQIHWAIVIGLTQILFTGFSGSVIINGSKLRSFTCLGMNATKENCRVLGTVSAMPERLLKIYNNQNMKIQVALDVGDLNELKEHELATLHPDLLLLIPSVELARIGGDKLAFLVDHWSAVKAVIKHILSAALLNDNINQFLQRVQTMALDREALETMGENLSLKQNLKSLGPLLAHIPLSQIFNITSEKRLKVLVFLKLYLNNEAYKWSEKRPITHRVWAKLLLEEEFPKPLNQWNNLDIQTVGEILIGAKPSELCQIDGRNLVDKTQLLNLGFSTLQVRALFTKLYKDTDFTTLDFRDLKPILVRLLPTQLQRFSSKITYFKSMQVFPLVKSVATSKQITEFLLREGKHRIPQRIDSGKDNILQIGRMVYSLPLSALTVYRNKPLSLDQLLSLQSKYLTSTQVYYLLGMGTELNISSPRFEESNVFLHALPTSKLPKKLNLSQVTHLSRHLSTDNLPRLMKFLYHALPTIGTTEVMKTLLQNPDGLKMLDYLPTRLLMNEFGKMSDIMKFHTVWSSLPKKMASSLYRSLNESLSNSVIDTESNIDNLTHGFNCQDISKSFTSDFILIISKYRQLLKMSNQEFPKELQQCTTRKLVEYLKLKSFFRQQYVNDTLVSLLSPVEIEAVGGWILSSLPLKEIIESTFMKDIVRQIGSMSASEILAAAPLGKMRAIVYNYLALQKPLKSVNAEELSVLGNLTMIIEENIIESIDKKTFKELLEGSYFDTRICSTLSQRNAWMKLLILAFGPTKNWSGEELKIVGNLLIVIPEEDLEEIPTDTWIQVADILELGYFKQVQWYKNNTFFEVCQKILMPSETESYVSSIKTVLTFYMRAAQFQLNTVIKLEQLRPVNDLQKRLEVNDKGESGEITTINTPNESSYLEDTENYEASPSTPLYQAESNKTSNVLKILENSNHSQNTSVTLQDIANSTESKEQNDATFNSNEKTGDSDEIEVIPVERSDQNNKPKAAEMVTDSQPTETDVETNYFRSEQDDMPASKDVITDESSKEQYKDETSPQISQPAESEDSFLSLPSTSSYIKLKEKVDNLSNTTKNYYTTESTKKSLDSEDIPPPMKFELITTDSSISNDNYANTDKYKIAPDLFSALTEIEKETQTTNKVGKQQESDEILQPITEEVGVSDTCIHKSECNKGKTVIQTLKIPLEMPAPAKVRLQDVLPRSKEVLTIYKNITEAFKAFIEDEDQDHELSQEVIDHDDILHPAMNSKESEVKKIEKRSIKMQKVSCEAMKTVGEEIGLILSEDIVEGMPYKELFDCIEQFASMKLPQTIRQIIWSRLDKTDAHLKGTLVSEAERKDVESYNFTTSNPWTLETIFTLTNFNKNPFVLKHILDQAFQHKELTIEEVISLGKIICNLPNLKDVLSPSVFLRSSVILGSILPCDYACLKTLTDIAFKKEAFGPTPQWTSFDIADLGIIIAGLNKQKWKELMENNPDILYGLQVTAGECLETSFIEAIPIIHIPKIPYFTRIAIYDKLKSISIPKKLQEAFSEYDEISLRENTTESSHSSTKYFNNYLKFIVIISNIIFYNYFNCYFALH